MFLCGVKSRSSGFHFSDGQIIDLGFVVYLNTANFTENWK